MLQFGERALGEEAHPIVSYLVVPLITCKEVPRSRAVRLSRQELQRRRAPSPVIPVLPCLVQKYIWIVPEVRKFCVGSNT